MSGNKKASAPNKGRRLELRGTTLFIRMPPCPLGLSQNTPGYSDLVFPLRGITSPTTKLVPGCGLGPTLVLSKLHSKLKTSNSKLHVRRRGSEASSSFLMPVRTTHRLSENKGSDYYSSSLPLDFPR